MTRVELNSTTNADGVLNLAVPLGKAEANRQVRVTVEPLGEASAQAMSAEQWKKFVVELAGSITDSSFRRHDQGKAEERDELFP
jgi:hypothetical protein